MVTAEGWAWDQRQVNDTPPDGTTVKGNVLDLVEVIPQS